MSTSKLRLRYLFERYYNKTATPQERDELLAIIDAGKNDSELSALLQQAWEDIDVHDPIFDSLQAKTTLDNILNTGKATPKFSKNRFGRWLPLLVAAAVLLVTGSVLYHYPIAEPVKYLAVKKAKKPINDALPGGNKATLRLANGQTIVLDEAGDGTIARQGSALIKKMADGRIVYNAAALNDPATAAVVTNTISTPRGGQYQVALSDGTQVWLNSASSLTFPTRFTGSKREVQITGEVYFEVAKNKAMPFKVKTHRGDVEVLGTHFNVMAYDDEQVMKTTLLEGAVNVNSGNYIVKLFPGQQAQISSSGNNKVVNNVDVEAETAWKDGIFQFNDAKADMILRQAARWYDVNIVYKHQIPEKEFNGRISKNVKASELLDMLRYAGIDVIMRGKDIIVN